MINNKIYWCMFVGFDFIYLFWLMNEIIVVVVLLLMIGVFCFLLGYWIVNEVLGKNFWVCWGFSIVCSLDGYFCLWDLSG